MAGIKCPPALPHSKTAIDERSSQNQFDNQKTLPHHFFPFSVLIVATGTSEYNVMLARTFLDTAIPFGGSITASVGETCNGLIVMKCGTLRISLRNETSWPGVDSKLMVIGSS